MSQAKSKIFIKQGDIFQFPGVNIAGADKAIIANLPGNVAHGWVNFAWQNPIATGVGFTQ